jgi:ribosomal protein S18
MKKIIITVDTEGDNLWDWKEGSIITTENANYIMRFQNLCEKYNFLPVYLTDYEMAQSDVFCNIFKKKAVEQKCEIGMHLHAWNTPPIYKLKNKYGGCPFITEYPKQIVFEKHNFLKKYIENRFEISPVSYRSGRWATNNILFKVLDTLKFQIDCSITPGINYKHTHGRSVSRGNNYCKNLGIPYKLSENLIEIPMTTFHKKNLHGCGMRNRLKHIIKGEELWLRPAIHNIETLKRIIKINENNGNQYAEFMIHSSELMPGGSPYCKTEESIEYLYKRIDILFNYIADTYRGSTLKEYGELIIKTL